MPKQILAAFAVMFILSMVTPVSAQSVDGPTYIVQSGDTLSSIAVRFNVTLEELMETNALNDPNLLSAGQALVIPGLEGVSGVLVTEVVQYGDSFRSLRRRTQVPETILRRLNRLVSPSELYVGIGLVVPQEEGGVNQLARVTPSQNETLLELAVKQDTHPWALVQTNQLEGSWDALPGDVLYSSGGTSDQNANGLPAVFEAVEVDPLPLEQGGTTIIRVVVPEGVSLGGMLADRPLHFFPAVDGNQVALQGVHALLDPGPYPLRLEATLADGNKQAFEQMVLVISGNYPSEDLYVESSTIDPAVTVPEDEQIRSITSNVNPEKYWSAGFTAPAVYPDCFTSRYGTRRTYYGLNTNTEIQGFHTGLDFCGGEGLPITAPAAGEVVFSGPLSVRGNAIIIDHGRGIFSGFWHQSELLVQAGEMVEQGQTIGMVGGTGRVTGAHLHWEIWVNGVQVNPMDWLNQTYP